MFSKCVRLTLHFQTVFTPGYSGDLDSTPASTSYWIYRSLTLLSLGSCNCEGGIWLFSPHTGMIDTKILSGAVLKEKNAVYKM